MRTRGQEIAYGVKFSCQILIVDSLNPNLFLSLVERGGGEDEDKGLRNVRSLEPKLNF